MPGALSGANGSTLSEWLTREQIYQRLVADELPARDETGTALFAARSYSSATPSIWSTPALPTLLQARSRPTGYSRDELLGAFVNARTINKTVGVALEGDSAVPAMMLLGRLHAASTRTGAGSITAWHLDDLGAQITDLLEDVSPEHVELTRACANSRRDGWASPRSMDGHPRSTTGGNPNAATRYHPPCGSPAAGTDPGLRCSRRTDRGTLRRAGVAQLHVVDKGAVTPGILVRQPYEDADIGYNKAERLAQRLSRIRRDLTVTSARGDIVTARSRSGTAISSTTSSSTRRRTSEWGRDRNAYAPPRVTPGHRSSVRCLVTPRSAASPRSR